MGGLGKFKIPPLKVAGLGLTETVDYNNEELFIKNKDFENTAPLNMIKNDQDILKSENILMSQESAQIIYNQFGNKKQLKIIPEDQIDERRKQKLKQTRKNLIPPKYRNQSTSSNQQSDNNEEVLFEKNKENQNRLSMQSIMTPNTQLRVESIIDNMTKSNQLTPNNQMNNDHSPNQQSQRSNGSFVGKNKIFVPFLSFPNNINEDPTEKIILYQRPDEQRFKLVKTKESVTPDRQPLDQQHTGHSQQSNVSKLSKGLGKRGKMLDIRTSADNSAGKQQDVAQKSFNFNKEKIDFNENIVEMRQIEMKKQNVDQSNEEEKQLNDSSNNDNQISFKIPNRILDLNKKPLIPSLKIPIKIEQPEGKDKIKQQIELQTKLNISNEIGNLTKLEKSLNQTNPKFQLLLEKKEEKLEDKNIGNEADMSEEIFYLKERGTRPIYQDEELHIYMISLIISLLLKPQRGTLDDLYCSQYPIDNGKQNVLYLLHQHLNNQYNQHIIPKLQKNIQQTSSPLAGQRLLKLLCKSLFDLSLYNQGKGWTKLGEGAYATVYSCELPLSEPSAVAIKQMFVPNTIYKRCVLHDIFTEITCLEELRLESSVTDLYDYGCDNACYYIIMKKYSSSLREWRMKQTKSLNENLSLYLSIYKEILKAIQTLHSHNVTHYDIKCDNILLDLKQTQGSAKWSNEDDEKMRITLGDFGECKMYLNEKDEWCLRNRGTDYIKSPEMLQLTVNTRKDTDQYDRRKQVGTNRLSDIWSLGCLFYELLTGEFLFHSDDYIQFYMRVTRPNEQLLMNEKLEKIYNNIYLVDFLKYILIRDPQLRPPIDSVLKRFEHVHALLVSTSSANYRFSLISPNYSQIKGSQNIDNIVENLQLIMKQNCEYFGGGIKEENIIQDGRDQILNASQSIQQNDDIIDNKQLINDDILDFYNQQDKWIKKNSIKAMKFGITHLVIQEHNISQKFIDKFDILEIPQFSSLHLQNNQKLKMNPFIFMPYLMDFLRKTALQNGKVLLIEDFNEIKNQNQLNIGIKYQLIRECLLLCLTQIFQTNAYETFTLIRSQKLNFNISQERLGTISKWSALNQKLKMYFDTFPKFQCNCGSCQIILKRQFANYSNIQIINCNCCQFYKNIETSQCPSPGCNEFIQYLSQYFKISLDSLMWGFVENNSIINYKNNLFFLSNGLEKNSQLVSIIEKKNICGNQSKDIVSQDYNLVSKSSATAKNYFYQGYQKWKLYKCKECHTWTHAVNEAENLQAILLNNRVKDNNQQNGILTIDKNSNGFSVPIIDKIRLKLPF